MLPADLKLTCKPELLVQTGAPGETILKTAEARDTDLIVLGARHTRVPHLVAHAPWRTVHRVICDAHCPVLTVSG
jgi:nucleotide-binding universal stress UspA family protein